MNNFRFHLTYFDTYSILLCLSIFKINVLNFGIQDNDIGSHFLRRKNSTNDSEYYCQVEENSEQVSYF